MFNENNNKVTDSFLQALSKVNEEVCETSSNREMAMSDLYKIQKYAAELYRMLENEECELDGWVASKITLASDYLGSVKHYTEHNQARDRAGF